MLLRITLRKKTLKWTALMTAVALAVAPMAAPAQENKGPPILRDTESEQLLREYTAPVGLQGLLRMNQRVRGVMAASRSSAVNLRRDRGRASPGTGG